MSEDDGLYVAKELLNMSEDVYLSYNNLIDYFYDGDKGKYEEELERLNGILYREQRHYEKLSDNTILHLLNQLDDSEMLSSIENNMDKWLNIVRLGFNFSEVSYFRILNLLRDKYILNNKLSRFDDEEIYDYEIETYDDIMLNNVIIENQLFYDFLSMFVANLNDYISKSDNYKIKKELNMYKYVCVFAFGNNNLDMLSKDHNLDGAFIYSNFLYDMLNYADRDFSYSYDIMKVDYLDKIFYRFLKEYKKNDKEVINIINKCFIKSIIMLYGEDYNRVNRIFNDSLKCEDVVLSSVIDDSFSIANKAKKLRLNTNL